MILDQTTDHFFASPDVRLTLRDATKLINNEEYAEAQITLDACLSKVLSLPTTTVSHDMTVLYVYAAVAADAGHDSDKASEILSEGIRTINARDPNERFYQSRLVTVQLWLLEKAGKHENAFRVAEQAVEKMSPPQRKGDDLTNMYLEDLYFQYSSLLLKHGEEELALATLQGITDRCAHAMTNYGPMACMEEGKFERFWLNQIGNDARGAIADKRRSAEAPSP